MKSARLERLLDAPDLPELIGKAQRVLGREQRLRQKFMPTSRRIFIDPEAETMEPFLFWQMASVLPYSRGPRGCSTAMWFPDLKFP